MRVFSAMQEIYLHYHIADMIDLSRSDAGFPLTFASIPPLSQLISNEEPEERGALPAR